MDIAHLAVTHKGSSQSRDSDTLLESKKRGFVHTGQVVTESHNLFLDGRDVTLNAELSMMIGFMRRWENVTSHKNVL